MRYYYCVSSTAIVGIPNGSLDTTDDEAVALSPEEVDDLTLRSSFADRRGEEDDEEGVDEEGGGAGEENEDPNSDPPCLGSRRNPVP